MSGTVEKREYLREHVAYEVRMLYHTLHALDTISLELDWNAFF